jgi:hypothetical protein
MKRFVNYSSLNKMINFFSTFCKITIDGAICNDTLSIDNNRYLITHLMNQNSCLILVVQ